MGGQYNLWDPKLGHLCLLGYLCSSFVFIDETAEDGPTLVCSWRGRWLVVAPGRVEPVATYWGTLGLLRQIGAVPRPHRDRELVSVAIKCCFSEPRATRLPGAVFTGLHQQAADPSAYFQSVAQTTVNAPAPQDLALPWDRYSIWSRDALRAVYATG
jgi:hypothetical protein